MNDNYFKRSIESGDSFHTIDFSNQQIVNVRNTGALDSLITKREIANEFLSRYNAELINDMNAH